MPKFIVKKLMRDNLDPDVTFENLRSLTHDEFTIALKEKLLEEGQELIEASSKEEQIDELADIYEILETLQKELSISELDIQIKKNKKKSWRGGFEKRYYADAVFIPEDHRLLPHCRSQPDKYPEKHSEVSKKNDS